MRLLITRPSERAGPLKARLEDLGFKASMAPLLTISFLEVVIPETPLQGIIFTSVQGVEAVKNQDSLKFFPAFAVGSKTAGAAGAVGFQVVHNAEGDVERLFDLVSKTCNPGKGLLLHLAGEKTVGNLVSRLQEKGFEAGYQTAYKAIAADGLPANVVEKISKRQIDGVLFFSTRTAGIFRNLVETKGLSPYLEKMEAFCLSENITKEAALLPWKQTHTATEPTEQSLIELLQVKRK
ncbi:MAG: uroporphyrinogen-III synthase [Sphingomonadales bacterium]